MATSTISFVPTGKTYAGRAIEDCTNYAEYKRASEHLATFANELAKVQQEVEALFPGSIASVTVNTCTLGWHKGTPADYSVYLGLKRSDGGNILSACMGAKTVEGGIIKLRHGLNAKVAEILHDLFEGLAGRGYWQSHKRLPEPPGYWEL